MTDVVFTSGPWIVSANSSRDRKLISANEAEDIADTKNGGMFIAHVIGSDRDANARLIAAAPDLFAALDACADAIRSFDGGDQKHETGWKHDELRDAWVKAWGALTKARNPS